MSTLKYAAYGSSIAIFANTELASMADGNGTFGAGGGLASNVFDNTALLYPEADLLVKLGSLTPAAGGYIYVAMLWSPDAGTSFQDPQYGSGQNAAYVPPAGVPIYSAGLISGGAAAQVAVIQGVKLRPGKAKILLVNKAGVALNAAGNTVVMYPATFTIT